jgi:hypothetical protein
MAMDFKPTYSDYVKFNKSSSETDNPAPLIPEDQWNAMSWKQRLAQMPGGGLTIDKNDPRYAALAKLTGAEPGRPIEITFATFDPKRNFDAKRNQIIKDPSRVADIGDGMMAVSSDNFTSGFQAGVADSGMFKGDKFDFLKVAAAMAAAAFGGAALEGMGAGGAGAGAGFGELVGPPAGLMNIGAETLPALTPTTVGSLGPDFVLGGGVGAGGAAAGGGGAGAGTDLVGPPASSMNLGTDPLPGLTPTNVGNLGPGFTLPGGAAPGASSGITNNLLRSGGSLISSLFGGGGPGAGMGGGGFDLGTLGNLINAGAGTAGGFSAANAFSKYADKANDTVREFYGNARGDLSPFITGGQKGMQGVLEMLGLVPGVDPTKRLEATPGYQFTKNQGLEGIINNQSRFGIGGNALRELTDYGSKSALNLAFLPQLQAMLGLSGQGVAAGGSLANAGSNASQAIAANLLASGREQAGARMNAANALTGGVNGMMNNSMISKLIGSLTGGSMSPEQIQQWLTSITAPMANLPSVDTSGWELPDFNFAL